jgi:hypothetical protein
VGDEGERDNQREIPVEPEDQPRGTAESRRSIRSQGGPHRSHQQRARRDEHWHAEEQSESDGPLGERFLWFRPGPGRLALIATVRETQHVGERAEMKQGRVAVVVFAQQRQVPFPVDVFGIPISGGVEDPRVGPFHPQQAAPSHLTGAAPVPSVLDRALADHLAGPEGDESQRRDSYRGGGDKAAGGIVQQPKSAGVEDEKNEGGEMERCRALVRLNP